jgi:hypothetical protein
LGVVVITFVLTRALPGDPAAYFAGGAATQEAIDQIRRELGLDRSWPEQFLLYLQGLARGDLGLSLTTGQPVLQELLTRLPASLELVLIALVLACAVDFGASGAPVFALRDGEIVTAVIVPRPSPRAASAFVKLGARRYLVISILMAAAVVEKDEAGRIIKAAVAVGAASPVARRLPDLESALIRLEPGKRPSEMIEAHHLSVLSPISDVRATDGYRREAAISVVGEALDRAAGAS